MIYLWGGSKLCKSMVKLERIFPLSIVLGGLLCLDAPLLDASSLLVDFVKI